MTLVLKQISLPLAEFTLAADVVLRSQVTGIFGPSGAGKTSLLDLIAGLRPPRSAFIQLDDFIMTDTSAGVQVPTRHRRVGYVPQDLALFPHLSVERNLLYGYRGSSAGGGLFDYEHVARVLEIEPLIPRSVHHLSGGEKQRVALARALLASPRLLLLDEPLASLDTGLKSRIIPYLARIRDEFHLPMLYVTHDWAEVKALCQEVLMLERGQFVRRGVPADFAELAQGNLLPTREKPPVSP